MALNDRTKLGGVLGIGVLAGLTSVSLSALLLALAGFLVLWGREPKRMEEFVGGLPFGNHLLKAMAHLDGIISSRED